MTTKNIGFIECGPGQNSQSYRLRDLRDYHLKKALVLDKTSEGSFKSQYPQVELVYDAGSIIDDNTIELVIVSAPSAIDMEIVNMVLQAGKHVRIL